MSEQVISALDEAKQHEQIADTLDSVSEGSDDSSRGIKRTRESAATSTGDNSERKYDACGVDVDEQQKRLEARRAYNRMNAARARKRMKDRISDLCIKVDEQAKLNTQLQKTNKELIERVDLLARENQELRRLAMESRAVQLVACASNDKPPFYAADSTSQKALHQQLVDSNIFPLLSQNESLGCMLGSGIPQFMTPADQQRLLRPNPCFQDLSSIDPIALQAALRLRQQQDLSRSSNKQGPVPQSSEQQYLDLVRSVLAGKQTVAQAVANLKEQT